MYIALGTIAEKVTYLPPVFANTAEVIPPVSLNDLVPGNNRATVVNGSLIYLPAVMRRVSP